MSTQQDIYAAGSESRPPMLNKENYVPWSSRLLRIRRRRYNLIPAESKFKTPCSIIKDKYMKKAQVHVSKSSAISGASSSSKETTLLNLSSAGSESRPPMLNKENYVPWSSRLLRYAKSRPNGKLIHNSILNGPYVRRMIPEPGDAERDVNVNETFHEQTDDELFERELKQIKVDDQAIQTILLSLLEDTYAAVDICETAQEIWL
nr:hypothetical protein [Tanacetum cinerariifolium]